MGKRTAKAGLAAAMAVAALLLLAAGAQAKKKPDLSVRFADGPKAAAVGEKLKVTDSVRNVGKRKAPKSKVSYLLSKDDKASGKDVELKGRRTVGKLKPGERNKDSAMVRVPKKTDPGKYRLIACADGPDRIKESDEGNNCEADGAKVAVSDPVGSGADIVADPAELDFGTVELGPTTEMEITVTNEGDEPSQALQVGFENESGDSLEMFAFPTSSCQDAVLEPDATCTVAIVFAPSETGTFEINAFVQNGGTSQGGTILNVPVTGTAVEPPVPITPLFYEFDETGVGDDVTAPFTLTNNSGEQTSVTEITLDGANAGDFQIQANACPGLLPAGNSCDFEVKFAPTAAGLRTVTIVAEGDFGTSYDAVSGFATGG